MTLYHGDVLATLAELPPESVDCVVTSPPYWGLRDYGQEGQLGLEPTPEQYVERMVEVFREVRRVLAAHGTVWLNLGDSYFGTGRGPSNDKKPAGLHSNVTERGEFPLTTLYTHDTLKGKDLVGIPWRVAFALQADGWYLRSDIIWSKPNPMPESVTDRPTKAHEYVFLLSKQPRYFFDQEAVRERYQESTIARDVYGYNHAFANQFKGSPTDGRHPDGKQLPPGSFTGAEQPVTSADMTRATSGGPAGPDGRRKTTVQGADGSIQHRDGERWPNGGRNIRSVWEIATQPYPEAHFATFPEELARRCIAAGCPEQVCRVCGTPRTRLVDVTYEKSPVHGAGSVVGRHYETGANNFDGAGMPRLNKVTETMGFSECSCLAPAVYSDPDQPSGASPEGNDGAVGAKYRPGIVLDPFMGSGTVAHVARKLGRHAVGIDLNESYLELAARRLQQQSLFAEAQSGL